MTHFSKFLTATVVALTLSLASCATTQNNPTSQSNVEKPQQQGQTYSENELIGGISTHLGVNSEAAASAIERLFRERGRPVGYITGEEGGGAFIAGVKYGKGTLWMKDGRSEKVYWQGATVGFDVGGDASKVFTLVYGLQDPENILRHFPGVDGSAYLVAGMAVNYQRAHGITLAPIRSGVGARLGANVGFTKYTKKRSYIPF
jgi:hypothetical protein